MAFNQALADRAIAFTQQLKLVEAEWAGKPLILEPWQKKIVADIFGTVTDYDFSLRRYRTAYIEVPRKNAKSTLIAALSLLLLCADGEFGAQIYSAAAEKEQAALIFRIAAAMVRQSPALSKRCKIVDSQKRIIYLPTNSFYAAISAEAHSKHGYNAHAVIYDELHAAPNRDLWDVLKTSMGSRRQPLMIAITTAGFDRNSICWEQHDYADKLLKGVLTDPSFYPVIYAADPDDDWKDPETWKKANPNYGVSVKPEFLEDECRKAMNVPAYQNTFKRLFLNIWTEQDERYMDMDLWTATAGEVDPEDLEGCECYAGLDLSSTTDLTAFVLVFPWFEGVYKVLPHFFIPAEGLRDRIDRDRVPYDAWIRDGYITATPGKVIDYDFVENHIVQVAKKYDLKEIAFDRWGAIQMMTRVQNQGLTVIPFGQGFASMSGPIKELTKFVIEKKLHHGNNPVLNWNFSNVATKQDPSGNIKFDKSKSTNRIDGAVATVMAFDRAARHSDGSSVYDERGILFL